MILNTRPDNRKEMVKAISERTTLPARYMGIPSCAYQIGAVTVNRDGTISCDDENVVVDLAPMLRKRGWLETAPEEVYPTGDLKASADDPVEKMNITLPVYDWTVPQLTNLLRMLCSKQHLLNRMIQGYTIYIEESFVTAITDSPPDNTGDFEARVKRAIDAECIRGIAFENGMFIFSMQYGADDSERQMVYNELLTRILKSAKAAVRVSIKLQYDATNEKCHANSWLMRMGFSGAQHKLLRRTLMGHLTGYAAFKSKADMQAHKKRQAARRLDLKAGVRRE